MNRSRLFLDLEIERCEVGLGGQRRDGRSFVAAVGILERRAQLEIATVGSDLAKLVALFADRRPDHINRQLAGRGVDRSRQAQSNRDAHGPSVAHRGSPCARGHYFT